MSNFWDLNDGTSAVNTDGNFDAGGGDFEPIPNDTGAIAAIEEAKWDGKDGDDWISIRWRIARPEAYANRVVFQKVKVFGTSRDKDRNATADKAKRMLAAIDANAGGCLRKLEAMPGDEDLMRCLSGKMMAIKIMIWKMKTDGEERVGNWVSAVAPVKGQKQHSQPTPKPAPKPAATETTAGFSEDDIPF